MHYILVFLISLSSFLCNQNLAKDGIIQVSTASISPSGPSLWDELADHPLDKKLRQCVDENGGTSTTTSCLLQSLEAWDKGLNAVYQRLIAANYFDAESKKQLKTSEIHWIKYKEAEFSFIEMQYRDSEGTMYPQIIAAEKVRIVRHRTIALESYFSAMTAERD